MFGDPRPDAGLLAKLEGRLEQVRVQPYRGIEACERRRDARTFEAAVAIASLDVV